MHAAIEVYTPFWQRITIRELNPNKTHDGKNKWLTLIQNASKKQ